MPLYNQNYVIKSIPEAVRTRLEPFQNTRQYDDAQITTSWPGEDSISRDHDAEEATLAALYVPLPRLSQSNGHADKPRRENSKEMEVMHVPIMTTHLIGGEIIRDESSSPPRALDLMFIVARPARSLSSSPPEESEKKPTLTTVLLPKNRLALLSPSPALQSKPKKADPAPWRQPSPLFKQKQMKEGRIRRDRIEREWKTTLEENPRRSAANSPPQRVQTREGGEGDKLDCEVYMACNGRIRAMSNVVREQKKKERSIRQAKESEGHTTCKIGPRRISEQPSKTRSSPFANSI
jgi:hypothetical protein